MAISARLFLSNQTQAARLPKSAAFPSGVEEVEVLAVGETRVIVPKGRRRSGADRGSGLMIR